MRALLFLLTAMLPIGTAAAQTIHFVDADAVGAADGTSWADAFMYLQDALSVAEPGDEVWVAEGTHRPTDGGPDPTDRDASFVLPSGVALFGGFDGTETMRDERDWEAHPTVLSGDVGAPGDFSDNAFHVVTASGTDGSTVLDGFTVTGGYGNGGVPRNRGGGIYGVDTDIVVRNAHIVENRVVQTDGDGGGGGAFFGGVSRPTLEGVRFERNEGVGAIGGGLWLLGEAPGARGVGGEGATADAEEAEAFLEQIAGTRPVAEVRHAGRNGGAPVVWRGVAFVENTARWGGGADVDADLDPGLYLLASDVAFVRNVATPGWGGFRFSGGTADMTHVRFHGNLAVPGAGFSDSLAGGLGTGGATFALANASFVGNVATSAGGLGASSGTQTLTNVTFNANEAEDFGGIRLSGGADLVVHNSVLWGNAGGEIDEVSGSTTLRHVLVAGGCPPDPPGPPSGTICEALLDADPLFVRPPDAGPDGAWGTGDDDYGDLRLQEGSPAVDFGLATFLPPDRWDLDGDGDTEEPLPHDLAGEPRVQGEAVDLGAYERPGPVSAEGAPPTGESLALSAYPNPSRGAVTLTLDVAEVGEVQAAVFDVLGREVAVLHEGPLASGAYHFALDGTGLAPGLYVVRVTGTGITATRRVTLLR